MEELRQRVITMQHKVNDLLDQPGHSVARRLKSEIQGLEDDLQVKKNAITIEDRVKRIIRILENDMEEEIMDVSHSMMLVKWFEEVREQLRRMA